MLRVALMSHQYLLLSRAGSRVLRPSMASTAASFVSRAGLSGYHGLLQPPAIIQPPARSVSALLRTPTRPAALGVTAGRVMVLGGAMCVLLACASEPASRQDRLVLAYGEDAMRLPVYAGDDAEYKEQVKGSREALGDIGSMMAADEEVWRRRVQNIRAYILVAANGCRLPLVWEGDEEGLAELTAFRHRLEEAVARYEALPGRLREHMSSAACSPELCLAMNSIIQSLPDDQLDKIGVSDLRACLEPARRLLLSEAGPLIELMGELEVRYSDARAMAQRHIEYQERRSEHLAREAERLEAKSRMLKAYCRA